MTPKRKPLLPLNTRLTLIITAIAVLYGMVAARRGARYAQIHTAQRAHPLDPTQHAEATVPTGTGAQADPDPAFLRALERMRDKNS